MDWDSDPELKKIRLEFIDSFLQREKELETFLSNYEQKSSLETLKSIQQVAHKLAGSAESYGFPALGEISGKMDDFFLEILEGTSGEISKKVKRIKSLSELLSEALKFCAHGQDCEWLLNDDRFKEM